MQVIGLHGPARAGKDTIADYLVEKYGFLKFAFSDALYREVADAYALPDESLLRSDATKEVTTERMSLDCCNDPKFSELARAAIIEEHRGIVFPRSVGLSPRWVLQHWGTEYRRVQDPDYWVKQGDLWMTAFTGTLKRVVTQEEHEAEIDSFIAASFDMLEVSREIAAQHVAPIGFEHYLDHPGVVVSGVRFANEYEWLKRYNGVLWHVDREEYRIPLYSHVSENSFPLRTGDKLIQNYSTVARLHTGIVLALQGNDIVNTSEE